MITVNKPLAYNLIFNTLYTTLFIIFICGNGDSMIPWWITLLAAVIPSVITAFVTVHINRKSCLSRNTKEMEDKWFVYCEADTLYFYRNWTGFCIYIVEISKNHETLCVTVDRDPEQHTETKIEGDKINLAIQLNSLLNKSNGDLWEQYIKHIKNSVKENEERMVTKHK